MRYLPQDENSGRVPRHKERRVYDVRPREEGLLEFGTVSKKGAR